MGGTSTARRRSTVPASRGPATKRGPRNPRTSPAPRAREMASAPDPGAVGGRWSVASRRCRGAVPAGRSRPRVGRGSPANTFRCPADAAPQFPDRGPYPAGVRAVGVIGDEVEHKVVSALKGPCRAALTVHLARHRRFLLWLRAAAGATSPQQPYDHSANLRGRFKTVATSPSRSSDPATLHVASTVSP